MRKISLPNDFLAEADEQLRQGHPVRIHIHGRSMRPFLKETGDCVELLPFPEGEPVRGVCYFYRWQGSFMVHRCVGGANGRYRMAGDGNLVRIEEVERTAITGVLQSVQHADGRTEDCRSERWIRLGLAWYRLRLLRRIGAALERRLPFRKNTEGNTGRSTERNTERNTERRTERNTERNKDMDKERETNRLQTQFLELLRSGLWGTPARAEGFDTDTDWKALYQAARQQTVAGIVLDGLETLPRERRPERSLYLQWCTQVLHLEEQNALLDRRIGELVARLRAEGIDPVLMKGQGVARNYRVPAHRTCGDIDLYVGFGHFERANRTIDPDVTRWHEIRYKHSGALWKGVEVEIHQLMAVLNAPGADRFLQREIARWYGQAPARQVRIGDTDVSLMPLEFEVVYLLIHALGHFTHEGLGLRQVCDWTCLLNRYAEHLDPHEVDRLLQGTGLRRGAGAFGFLATEVLGLPADHLPFELTDDDRKLGRHLLQNIWQMGNFGRFDPTRSQRPKGYWRGKWHTFVQLTSRNLGHRRMAPAEAYWLPYSLIRQFVHAQLYRLRRNRFTE